MTSAINPTNINGAYPVAGQDNDSQGFRDNFTNIKTNFEYAGDEITDLQNKVVLKAALSGTVLNNNMNNSVLSNAQLLNMSEPRAALGTVTTATLNYAASPYYTLSTGGSTTISFSNLPSAGQVGRIRLQITVTNIAYTLTLPATVTVGVSNLQGYSNNIITFNQTGVYEFEFETSDGGSTISIFDLNRNRDPIYLPSTGLVANAAAISLSTTSSYFTTAATGETNTLAAGSNGQIKVLAYNAEGGASDTRIVTVSNAGWQASGTGTVTFTEFGQTATLMYINSKWFVTGMGPGASDTFPTLA
jgi:hypothetical protein